MSVEAQIGRQRYSQQTDVVTSYYGVAVWVSLDWTRLSKVINNYSGGQSEDNFVQVQQ